MSAIKNMLENGAAITAAMSAPDCMEHTEREAIDCALASLLVYAMSRGLCDCCVIREARADVDDALRQIKDPLSKKEAKQAEWAYARTGDVGEAMASLPYRDDPMKALCAFVRINVMAKGLVK